MLKDFRIFFSIIKLSSACPLPIYSFHNLQAPVFFPLNFPFGPRFFLFSNKQHSFGIDFVASVLRIVVVLVVVVVVIVYVVRPRNKPSRLMLTTRRAALRSVSFIHSCLENERISTNHATNRRLNNVNESADVDADVYVEMCF